MNDSKELVRINVRRLRIRYKLTQEQLAFKSEVTTALISKMERELPNPTIQTLDHIASGFGIRTIQLLEEDIMSVENIEKTELERRFRLAQDLPPEAQQELSMVIDTFLSICKHRK